MTPTMKDLGIDRLSPAQKVELALEIWESLDGSRPAGGLSAVQKETLARRDAEMTANPEIAVTWDQIRSRLESQ